MNTHLNGQNLVWKPQSNNNYYYDYDSVDLFSFIWLFHIWFSLECDVCWYLWWICCVNVFSFEFIFLLVRLYCIWCAFFCCCVELCAHRCTNSVCFFSANPLTHMCAHSNFFVVVHIHFHRISIHIDNSQVIFLFISFNICVIIVISYAYQPNKKKGVCTEMVWSLCACVSFACVRFIYLTHLFYLQKAVNWLWIIFILFFSLSQREFSCVDYVFAGWHQKK